MPVTSWMPVAAGLLCVLFMAVVAAPLRTPRALAWALPATLSVLFLLFSVVAATTEGPFAFWVEHTRNLWGNQIWFDLLLAAATAWAALWPQARRLGMRPLPWLLVVAGTGSIGLLAMVARMHWLRGREGVAATP